MTDLRFDGTVKIETVFGKVEVKFVEQYTDNNMVVFGGKSKVIESHYLALMLDGEFNGWSATSIGTRDGAVANLLKDVADRYARDTVASAIKTIES